MWHRTDIQGYNAKITLVLMCGLVSACGGGGDEGHTTTTPPPAPQLTYAQYEAASAALHATWDIVAATDPLTLPVSGSADYAGVVRLDVENGPGDISMDGRLALHADFSANTISGDASQFVDENEVAYSGALTLSNGVIDRNADLATEYTYTGNLDGSLTGAGETYAIVSDLSGDFVSSTTGAVTGVIAGTSTYSLGTGYVYGVYIGEK